MPGIAELCQSVCRYASCGVGINALKISRAWLIIRWSNKEDGNDLYQLITASGPDAESFLQGQLTQDVHAVSPGRTLLAAACTPKGRVLATVLLCRRADGFDLIVAADIAERFLQRLTMYKLRAKLELQLREDLRSFAVDGEAASDQLAGDGLSPDAGAGAVARKNDSLAVRIDSRVVAIFGTESIIETIPAAAVLDDTLWAVASIRAGQVSIGAANSEKYTPHMLSLDLAGAISFDKGCYTGQEVVARTEHLGKSRRRLMRYTTDAENAAIGDELTLDGEAAGTVVNAMGQDILAVTPQATHEKTLQLNGGDARPATLPWS